MFIAVDGQAAGLVAVADRIKPSAREGDTHVQGAGYRGGDDHRR